MTKTGEAARPTVALEPESLADLAIRYQRPITIAGVALALGVGGYWMWSRSNEIKETRAAEALLSAESAFGAGNFALAQPELERIVGRWSSTSSGAQAAMLLAQTHYADTNYAAGVEVLRSALRSAPAALRPGLQALMAGGLEASGQRAEAATAFEAAATASSFRQEKDGHLMNAARNHAAAGDVESAKRIYAVIVAGEDSRYGGEARVRLGEITSKQ